ncbi:hypothetical protein X802_10425 [Thermococcus guaymasensis DSM 11113]|uniref:CRISPR-associated protein n=1 Tax=Thermococcus guaymasensis DSM 11113 TaxID=1432656 RepID=A0A0X1KMQ8_9EURY|nr:hypothetical protein [Thermococcus guaymasensis]AJC72520.1 hypothetical protein X802_10425 [Thermococcus guaymasensis DSM 11113]
MTVHVALLGRTPWALVNTYYASVMRGSRPRAVYVITERRYSHFLPKIIKAIKEISRAYGFEPTIETRVIEDDDFQMADRVFRELFSKINGEEVVLNMTSGRKALVAAAIVQSRNCNLKEILYMALLDVDFPDRPYMMLPLHMQRLKNFLGDGYEH